MDNRVNRRVVLAGAGAGAAVAASGIYGAAAAQSGPSKSFIFLVRKDGMSHEEFVRYWIDVHGALAKKVRGIRSLVFHDIPEAPAASRGSHLPTPKDQVAIDGIAEAVVEPVPSPESDAFHADTAKFVGKLRVFQVKEKVWLPPISGGQCLLGLLKRKPDWTHEAFVKHWNDVHGAMAAQVPEVGGFVTNEVLGSAGGGPIPLIEGLGEPDGIAQSWHRRPGTPVASPEGKKWYEDGTYLVGEARAFRTQEHVIIPRA